MACPLAGRLDPSSLESFHGAPVAATDPPAIVCLPERTGRLEPAGLALARATPAPHPSPAVGPASPHDAELPEPNSKTGYFSFESR